MEYNTDKKAIRISGHKKIKQSLILLAMNASETDKLSSVFIYKY